MNYCSHCSRTVVLRIPPGDSIARYVCDACGQIHYQNPRIIVGSLPLWQDRILLCRRAIEPRIGKWTLPAGFLENGETLEQGAIRETMEEAGGRIAITELYSVYSIPHVAQVYMIFLARLLDLDYAPGLESLEVDLFLPEELPWEELAFTSIRFALERFTQGHRGLQLGHHRGSV
ncbi:MAG: NUDIX hydrolase [Spirochaetales bacterium]|nr:NUDIX hydrolase [Spirochaetales bacterium]